MNKERKEKESLVLFRLLNQAHNIFTRKKQRKKQSNQKKETKKETKIQRNKERNK
jgi:hypothetical protein